MNGSVQSPRLFGHSMWFWTSVLTTRFVPDGHGGWRLPWRCRIARRILWPLCRALTGHRQALGETGYGGGGMLDVFCAYCSWPWQVPLEEMPSQQLLADLFHEAPPEIRP